VTQAEIIAALAELKKAIATGARSVTHAGKTVTYRDLAEMQSVRAYLEAQLLNPRRPPCGLATLRGGLL
jgi:hypothetical protein